MVTVELRAADFLDGLLALGLTGEEFRSWCEEADFRRFEVIPLAGPSSAAVATSRAGYVRTG
jgi:hypothetical protein